MDKIIPLFPLKLVVFPESKYPLHIFESRYKKMVRYCLQNDKGFGIIAKIGNVLSTVGSYVRISKILKKYENGEYDLIVQGINRFLIEKIDVHKEDYYIGSVYEYNDINTSADSNLFEEVRKRFSEILKRININPDEAFWNNLTNAESKSFKIAEKSGLSISEQQEFLGIQDENKRLNYLKEHFEKLEDQLAKNMSDKIYIINDGFVN